MNKRALFGEARLERMIVAREAASETHYRSVVDPALALAAARACQNFCRSELAVFQRVMGQDCTVERSEHLLAGARRCVYVIKPVA